jgi:hypothetical protein
MSCLIFTLNYNIQNSDSGCQLAFSMKIIYIVIVLFFIALLKNSSQHLKNFLWVLLIRYLHCTAGNRKNGFIINFISLLLLTLRKSELNLFWAITMPVFRLGPLAS